MNRWIAGVLALCSCVWLGGGLGAVAAELPSFDFRRAEVAASWRPQHDIQRLEPTADGLLVRISGSDPYFAGPARDYPAGVPLWLNLRLRSDTGGTAQVFYYPSGSGPSEPRSVRFPVPAGVWYTARVPVEPLGPGYALRLDPPGESGTCIYQHLGFEERMRFADPSWPTPVAPKRGPEEVWVRSGEVELSHHREQVGGFVIRVGGVPMAVGQTRPLVGYVVEREARWFSFGETAVVTVVEAKAKGGATVRGVGVDADGGRWTWSQTFSPGSASGVLEVETVIEVDRDRALLHLPVFTLFAGSGSDGFGARKQQAVLAGVEYLDDEPSSSEKDLEGPQANRQVTDTAKLTFPLAAVVAQGRYLGLTWDMQPWLATVFDSPDRLYGSGGHVMGLLVPGSDGVQREEGSLIPYDTVLLPAGQALRVRARVLGGRGDDVVPALRQYLALAPLPEVPKTGYGAEEYARLAARGWLETGIREGDLYRHAVVGNFGAGPAADAAYFMEMLSSRVGDEALAARLKSGASAALARVSTPQWFASGVGHVRAPAAPLAFGSVVSNADAALASGRAELRRFAGDGTVRYVRSGAIDYARTHWTNEANGFTAQAVRAVLENAVFSGNSTLASAGLRALRAMNKFHGGVPRGAQTWEVPLHTPDILASAHLVKAYTLGYLVSGDSALLEEARHWAWTGVPFVYLRSVGDGPVGPYATTPVLGATQWVAPNWIGLPVQWCGLVYADALYGLADLDPEGPWLRLADGIAASGVQQTYPENDARYRGLLPDSYHLKARQRNPANINPATVLACAVRLFGWGPAYDVRRFGHHDAWVQAAGRITPVREDARSMVFAVHGWPTKRHWVLVNGLYGDVQVRIDGRETVLVAPHGRYADTGRLLLEVSGSAEIEIRHEARTALRIEREGPGDGAWLGWPAAAAGYALETTETWESGARWNLVPGVEEVPGSGRSVARVRFDGAAGFFRLRRPDEGLGSMR